MKDKQHITAFYLEALLMIIVFIGTILILTRVFGAGKAQSGIAKMTTNAVCLAENAAEAVAASESPDDVLRYLNENGNAGEVSDGLIRASYKTDMTPDPAGEFAVDVTWEPEESSAGGGTMVRSTITVRYENREEPVYVLNTAVYLREVIG